MHQCQHVQSFYLVLSLQSTLNFCRRSICQNEQIKSLVMVGVTVSCGLSPLVVVSLHHEGETLCPGVAVGLSWECRRWPLISAGVTGC